MDEGASGSQWREPWPSGQPYWQDPPWVMKGRTVTAWFQAPWDVLAASLSPDLLPQETSASVRTRLRFYELTFEAVSPRPGQLAPASEAFHEAALGFAAEAQGIRGEVSAYLWSDSPVYTMWGREAFGWPIREARVTLVGSVWEETTDLAGEVGSAVMQDPFGSAGLTDISVSGDMPASTLKAPWLTPRRTLLRAGLDGDLREVLVVRPEERVAGTCYRGTARVWFDFAPGHPLSTLAGGDADVEVVDGFELIVGADVDVLR